MQNFTNLEAAWVLVKTTVDDPIGESLYESIRDEGCCGFFDEEIMINGRLAKIGCNFGH